MAAASPTITKGAPGSVAPNACVYPGQIEVTATWTTTCWAEPLFGGATQSQGNGTNISASAYGLCQPYGGTPSLECDPTFFTSSSNALETVTALASPAFSLIPCVRAGTTIGTSYTCYAYCDECVVNVDKCPCASGVTCFDGCCCRAGHACGGTPIVLDSFEEGFHLTSLANGVQFRLLPGDPLYQMSWTDANWRNGWLALDRDGDGTIDNFTELFGNLTPQPPSDAPNGFRALAVFDEPANGGNGNGFIDPGDAVYPNLRVWVDANHNGISEANELHTLQELGIFKIGLRYHVRPYVDQYGNRFRYKGSVWDEGGNERDVCYDVILQIQLD